MNAPVATEPIRTRAGSAPVNATRGRQAIDAAKRRACRTQGITTRLADIIGADGLIWISARTARLVYPSKSRRQQWGISCGGSLRASWYCSQPRSSKIEGACDPVGPRRATLYGPDHRSDHRNPRKEQRHETSRKTAHFAFTRIAGSNRGCRQE